MPDIRDVLKGLSPDDRALYMDIRMQMRRAYLAAHSKLLPIDRYEISDDQFLDLIDIKIAMLFDRSGGFNHVEGSLDSANAAAIEQGIKDTFETAATRMMKATQLDNGKAAGNLWPQNGNK